MAVKIRLTRGGRKKLPFYHVVVADERAPRDGRYIEKIGYYDPLAAKDSDQRLVWNTERVNHWLDQGAQPTGAVSKMIVAGKLGSDKQRAKFEAVIERRKTIIMKRIEEKAKAEAAVKAAEAAEEAAPAPAEAAPAEAAAK